MRVLVCGSRDWTDCGPIRRELEALDPGVLIHGDARGADRIAGAIGTELGWEVLAFPADWSRHSRAAGPIRNTEMLREGRPDRVYAFYSTPHLSQSRGTANMVRQARQARVKTIALNR